jgi:hypothetical protein
MITKPKQRRCGRGAGSADQEERRKATLFRLEQGLRVEPADGAVLRALTARAHAVARDPGGRSRVVADPVLLGELRAEGGRSVLYTRATCEPVVRQVLTEAGYKIHRVGRRAALLPPPRTDWPQALGPPEHGLLRAVREQEWGLVRYDPRGLDPARLVAQVALAWPELTVSVAVATREQAWELGRALRAYLPGVSVPAGQNSPATVSRVVVATYKGLGHSAQYEGPGHKVFDISWTDIVIALDALAAVSKVATECLSRAARARLYGLLPMDRRPAPFERDLLTFLFGLHEISLPWPGHRERPVQVVRYPIKGGPKLPPQLGTVQLKRRGLWQNALRNRKVADLARAFAAGRRDALDALFPGLGALLSEAPSRDVLVLVENVEHALALADRLPGWALFTGRHVHQDGLPAGLVGRLHVPLDTLQDPPRAVVTAAALADQYLDHVDVLVRADGGLGPPPLDPGALVEPDQGPPRPLLLVDLDDRHHPALRRQSRLRREAYDERGWLAPGADPVEARAERFLAARSGRRPR